MTPNQEVASKQNYYANPTLADKVCFSISLLKMHCNAPSYHKSYPWGYGLGLHSQLTLHGSCMHGGLSLDALLTMQTSTITIQIQYSYIAPSIPWLS